MPGFDDRQASARNRDRLRRNTQDDRTIEEFVRHLNRCRCPRYGRTHRRDIRKGARLLLRYARFPELFPNARNDAMTRAGFEYILRKHVRTAETRCPTLSSKHVSPHVLRHTCALTILQATKDLRKVSLWLGHSSMQTTEIYTRADPSVKLEALESVIAPKLRTGRFKATDKLIEMLKAAPNMRSKKPAT